MQLKAMLKSVCCLSCNGRYLALRPERPLLHVYGRRTLLEPRLAELEHVTVLDECSVSIEKYFLRNAIANREHLQNFALDALRFQFICSVELPLAVRHLRFGTYQREGRRKPDFPEELRGLYQEFHRTWI
jgi:hypothetical protein